MQRPFSTILIGFFLLLPLTAFGGMLPMRDPEELPVQRATLHYTVFGKGKPILIIGGIPGLSSDYIIPLAQEIGKTNRCIVVDLRGTGKSKVAEMDTTTLNIRETVDDFEALRKHLKLQSWCVFGHSAWGGIVSMAYSARFPQRVRGLILAGSGGPDLMFLEYYYSNIGGRLTKEDSARINTITNTLWSTNRELAKVEQFKITMGTYFADRRFLPDITATISPTTYSPEAAQIVWRSLFRINYDQRALLKSFRKPTLVVCGKQDPIGQKTASDIGKALPQSKLEFLENCGHFPWIEQKQKFYGLVSTFLKGLK